MRLPVRSHCGLARSHAMAEREQPAADEEHWPSYSVPSRALWESSRRVANPSDALLRTARADQETRAVRAISPPDSIESARGRPENRADGGCSIDDEGPPI